MRSLFFRRLPTLSCVVILLSFSFIVSPSVTLAEPSLASAYQGTVHNTTYGGTTTLELISIVQNQQAISGNVVIGPGLIGSGPFTGTIGNDGSINFTDTPTDGASTIFFSGSLYTDGSLGGTYSIPDMNQGGTWQTTPWSYDPGGYGGMSGLVSNFDTSLIEPNEVQYANYCGPAASRVLISAWTSNVPSLDTLATDEKTNQGKVGTWMSDMVDPINKYIGQNYYEQFPANSQAEFSNRIGWDITHGHPLITAIKTAGNGYTLNGWNPNNPVDHIIMIYGFDFRSSSVGYVDYFETAGTVAGTNATGTNFMDYNAFWSLVTLNNVQLFGV